MNPCNDHNAVRDLRCVREPDHEGLHRNGLYVWRFTEPAVPSQLPRWRRWTAEHKAAKELTYSGTVA